jgi:hypothetical protein
MKAFAVDLGGSHATCALVEDRTILDSCKVPTDGKVGLRPILPRIGETLKSLLSRGHGSITRGFGEGAAGGLSLLLAGGRHPFLHDRK